IVDGGSIALVADLPDGVGAHIDIPPQALGLLARNGHRPSRPAANGAAPLEAVRSAPVVDNEGDGAGRRDAHTETLDLGVVGDAIAGGRPLERPDQLVRKLARHLRVPPVSAPE